MARCRSSGSKTCDDRKWLGGFEVVITDRHTASMPIDIWLSAVVSPRPPVCDDGRAWSCGRQDRIAYRSRYLRSHSGMSPAPGPPELIVTIAVLPPLWR